MKFLRAAPFVLIALLVLLAEKNTYGQWKNIAPGLLRPTSSFAGAVYFKDHILWAGSFDLCYSLDTGKSWTKTPFFNSSGISDINFFDRFNGLVATASDGVFLTSDGGQNWKRITPRIEFYKTCFNGSTNDICAISHTPNNFYTSHDGGASFTTAPLPDYGLTFAIANDGTMVSFSYNSTNGEVSRSVDGAQTWNTISTIDGDSWSLAADSCDSKRLYLLNEEWAWSNNNLSEIYTSSDGGFTWVSAVSFPVRYFSGAMSTTANSIFATTVDNHGTLRSTDRGLTWKNIGGPSLSRDNRAIFPVNDNIVFSIDTAGNLWGTYNSGGDSVVFIPSGMLDISPKIVFDLDTVDCNGSIQRAMSVRHGGCIAPTITKWLVIGKDSSSYTSTDITYDSIHITFTPKTSGDNRALLVVTLSDGSSDTIALKGYYNKTSFTCSPSPQSLFAADSIYLCNLPKTEKFILNSGGCFPNILTQNITGPDANDYTMMQQIGSPLNPLDSVTISFDPSDTGARKAAYEITFDDGTKISIPLTGYSIPPHSLSLTTSDQFTDMIGGSIKVPITINGLDHAEDVDLVLHYDKELTYHGSFSPSNVQFDIPNEGWTGRSKLRISQAKPNAVLGYATFDVFNDSLSHSQVTFDSVTVLTTVAPCQYILPASVTSIITPPSGCGIQTISRFMHNGTLPQLSIIPNPTSGEITISTTRDLGEASVAIYDMLGVERGTCKMKIGKTIPAKLMLPVANGMYNIRVTSTDMTYNLRVVVSK